MAAFVSPQTILFVQMYHCRRVELDQITKNMPRGPFLTRAYERCMLRDRLLLIRGSATAKGHGMSSARDMAPNAPMQPLHPRYY